MKIILGLFLLLHVQTVFSQEKNAALSKLFSDFIEENYKLNPLTATQAGDYRYNDKLSFNFTDQHIAAQKMLFTKYLDQVRSFDRKSLNANDQVSYDIFRRNMDMGLEELSYKMNLIPFNQFRGLHTSLGQLGNGTGAQPFKTVQDYENWLARSKKFADWADSAIVYFRKGMAENFVLPRALVVKMIPQLKALQSADVTKSVYYGPVDRFPESFSEITKFKLANDFRDLIKNYINPAYNKLEKFLEQEYLPKARSTSGLTGIRDGDKLYNYFIRSSTTTNKSPEELFNTGLSEVKRIRSEMEKVKKKVKFKESLDSFFVYTKTDPKFLPYKTAEEVLEDYRAILKKIEPHLDKYFRHKPKTSFEVRQTEAFRAASAAAQYNAGLPDGTRPGIFYVPIVNPLELTKAKESLFLHEAIPGHHFQVMLQKENKSLPKFRQESGNSIAYSEGWALYVESMGELLGCYEDPIQYFYALGSEMHRAIRLVVDVGLHSKGWTREQAIKYMKENEPITEQSATAEIERYMAIPGQALSYKVGELKIKELRDKYKKQLGSKFSLAAFHDEILKDGAMPLTTLEEKMDLWAARVIQESRIP